MRSLSPISERQIQGIIADPELRSVLVEINSMPALDGISALLAPNGFVPDDTFNKLDDHSSKRRAKDAQNTAQNWIFTKR